MNYYLVKIGDGQAKRILLKHNGEAWNDTIVMTPREWASAAKAIMNELPKWSSSENKKWAKKKVSGPDQYGFWVKLEEFYSRADMVSSIRKITRDTANCNECIWICEHAYNTLRKKSPRWMLYAYEQRGFRKIHPYKDAWVKVTSYYSREELYEYKKLLDTSDLNTPNRRIEFLVEAVDRHKILLNRAKKIRGFSK